MSALKFEELTDNTFTPEEERDSAKKGMEIEIKVAGPKEMMTKTVMLSLDQRGLIKLNFAQGGKLPALLQGRFTSLENVKTVLAIWQERENKHYNLDESIKHPNNDGAQSVSDLVDEAAQNSAALAFPEDLDEALKEAEDLVEEEGKEEPEDDDITVTLEDDE